MKKYYKFSWKTKTSDCIVYYSVVNIKNYIKIMILTVGKEEQIIEFKDISYNDFKTNIVNNHNTINITTVEFETQLELFEKWLDKNNFYNKYINNKY